MKWLTLSGLVLGSCLLALAAYVYPWTRTVDARLASLKLAEIPTSEIQMAPERVTTVRTPDSEEWRRLIAEWGAPTFIAAVASRSEKAELRCFPQTQLALKVTDLAGRTIPAKPTRAAPYGYTSRCAITGIEFAAAPGSEFLLHATRLGSQTETETEGELIVVPYWRYEKDRLVGDMIAPDLRRIAMVLGTLGICCLGASLWSHRRQTATHVAA
jgi:hypothetical protein